MGEINWSVVFKLLGAVGTALGVFAGGGALGHSYGYSQRDLEVREALSRAKCKLHEVEAVAQRCGWERPDNWCEALEDR